MALPLMALPVSADSIGLSEFTLSNNITTSGTQQQFDLLQVNPINPQAGGINVGMLVSYGEYDNGVDDPFTGIFFEFANRSVDPNEGAVMTDVFFESDDLELPSLVEGSGGQVSYEIEDAGNGKPGGFGVRFNLNADPDSSPVENGVGNGENLLVGLSMTPNDVNEYTSILSGLFDGDWIIGAHVQQVVLGGQTGESIWLQATPTPPGPDPNDNVVPIPSAAGLGLLGLGLIAARRRLGRAARA